MQIIQKELETLNVHIINILSDSKNQISGEVLDYLSAKSKRIRPSMIFLAAKAMETEVNEEVYNLACAVELIHNSTLVHDDILDNADTRRGRVSLNYKLGNSLSVLAGDLLLSAALQELAKCKKAEVIDIFSKSLYSMCRGEINQNFTIGRLPDMDEYIKKSEDKTAELFKAPLVSLCIVSGIEEKDKICSFAKNFGIAFQIKDDLLNILNTDNTKPVFSDVYNGIYTAPVIYMSRDCIDIENCTKTQIINILMSDKKYIQQTVDLIKEYADRAIASLDFIKDNEYKREIIKITENLYKAGM